MQRGEQLAGLRCQLSPALGGHVRPGDVERRARQAARER
jgi:hypothetical protein